MIYVTGDTHGEVVRFEELKRKYFLSRKDTLIVAGDFGCIFGMGRRDEVKLDALAALPQWAGDRIFLDLIRRADTPFFSLKLQYRGETLVYAALDGKELAI